jgi:hypothetical protein
VCLRGEEGRDGGRGSERQGGDCIVLTSTTASLHPFLPHAVAVCIGSFIRGGTADFLRPDAGVQQLLASLPQPKYIFTNCREEQAAEALECLGIGGHFGDTMFGSDFMGEACKPEKVGMGGEGGEGGGGGNQRERVGDEEWRHARC